MILKTIATNNRSLTNNFYIVDVFAQRPYSGNQLAVVVDDAVRDSATMQQIAAEMDFSETTFVTRTPDNNGIHSARIFTPARELDFAGHPILGTAWVLREYVTRSQTDQISLGLPVGQVPVTFESSEKQHEAVWFRAPPMSLGAEAPRALLAQSLGIAVDDIDTQAPCQTVAAGTAAVMVPLRSLDALNRCRFNLDAYQPLTKQGFPPLIYLFTRETHQPDSDLSVRFFFEAHGPREDPATGNGAAFCGAYLLHHQFLNGTDLSLRIEQGHQLGRPSLVMLRARVLEDAHEVHVGGQVLPVIQGTLL